MIRTGILDDSKTFDTTDVCVLIKSVFTQPADSTLLQKLVSCMKKPPIRYPLWTIPTLPYINLHYHGTSCSTLFSIVHTWYDLHRVHSCTRTYTKNVLRCHNKKTRKHSTYSIFLDEDWIFIRPMYYITKCIRMFDEDPTLYKVVLNNCLHTPCYIVHNRRKGESGIRCLTTNMCCIKEENYKEI